MKPIENYPPLLDEIESAALKPKEKLVNRFIFAALFLFAVLFTGVTFAQENNSINLEGLSQEQISQIKTQVQQAREQVRETFSIEAINEYAEIGRSVGVGLASAAREMGVAVNEFAGTGVGKLAMFLIFWHIAGGEMLSEFLSIVIGLIWFTVVVSVWTSYFRKMCIYKTIETTTSADGKTVVTSNSHFKEGEVDGTRFTMFICLVIALIPAIIFLA